MSISNGDVEGEKGTIQIENMTSGDDANPEARYLLKEEIDYIGANLSQIFSEFEWKVWAAYIGGKSKSEIAAVNGKTEKSIANALQRIKIKLETYLGK